MALATEGKRGLPKAYKVSEFNTAVYDIIVVCCRSITRLLFSFCQHLRPSTSDQPNIDKGSPKVTLKIVEANFASYGLITSTGSMYRCLITAYA